MHVCGFGVTGVSRSLQPDDCCPWLAGMSMYPVLFGAACSCTGESSLAYLKWGIKHIGLPISANAVRAVRSIVQNGRSITVRVGLERARPGVHRVVEP